MITLDGKHINEFGYRAYLDHEHPATPDISNKPMKIPGREGEWDFGAEIGARPFNLTIRSMDMDDNLLQQKQNEFISYLFDAYGNPRVMKLVFDYEPDKYYMARLRNSILPSHIAKIIRYNGLPLVAYDPYKYATANQYDPKESYLYNQGYLYDIGLMYDNPTSFNWIYEKHYSGINNYSSLVTNLQLEIQGTVINPSVTNLNDNTTLTLPTINNGRLLIDGKRFAVIRNGQDILDGSNYNFFHIQPGEVGFLFEGKNPNATVTYSWMHKFM